MKRDSEVTLDDIISISTPNHPAPKDIKKATPKEDV